MGCVAFMTAAAASADDARLRDNSTGADWPAYGRTYGEQHYSPLDQVSTDNVGQLGLMWSFDLGAGNPATIPIAVDDVLYFASGLSVVRALDASTGKLLWTYDPQVGKVGALSLRQGWGSRGLGYWNSRVYVATSDGRLIAIYAKTGQVAWSVLTVDRSEGRYITGAPRLFQGKVIIGHGGNDSLSVHGYVTCYDATSGRQLWRFYTVPGDPVSRADDPAQAMAAKTWFGDWKTRSGGGTVWNAFTYDPETNTVFLGTGNGSPWNRRVRSADQGDNLFIASIVALNASTGRYKWHYQVTPGDTWDYDASMDMQLADLTINGHRRKVLIQASKNGFLYVIDRTTGALISAEAFAKVTWASKIDLATGRPVEDPAARYPEGKPFELWPSFFGAHSWQPSAYSPKAQLIFVPVIERGSSYSDAGIDADQWVREPGNAVDTAVIIGAGGQQDPLNGTSWLMAIAPATQRHVWKVRTAGGGGGGVMATGGDLVFQGDISGNFNAYAAESGAKLWSFAAASGIVAAPITYLAYGRQFVSIVAGVGTGSALLQLAPHTVDYRTQAKRVLTFGIGGHGELAAPTPVVMPVAPPDPDYRPDEKTELQGAITFGRQCTNCHGGQAASAGNAPDLRASAVPLSGQAFAQVVREGALLDKGMPRFAEFDDAKLDAVRQYIRSRAADLRAHPTPSAPN